MKGRKRRGSPPPAKKPPPVAAAGPVSRETAEAVRRRLTVAVDRHRQGNFTEAETFYRAALAADPRSGDALNLLGVLCLQTGRADEAVILSQAATETDGAAADFHDNHGSALAAVGRVGEAAAAHLRAVRLNPAFAAARFNLANALSGAGRPDAAAASLRAALALKPDYLKAWLNLGNAGVAVGDFRKAAVAFARAVALAPDWAEARSNLSDALSAFGDLDGALTQARASAALHPNDAHAHYNVGVVQQQSGRYEQAELAYREALRRRPDHLGAWNNLGGVLRRLRRADRAAVCHRNALALQPDFLETYYNLGNALHRQGRFVEAAAIYERVLARNPDLATATHNLGMLSLIHGDLARGWEGYEKRFAAHETKPDRRPPLPRWHGEPLNGRRLMVWREQGVGDEIMFASCYADLERLDGPVTVETEPRLISLLARSFPRLTFRPLSCDADGRETLDDLGADLHIPAGSLPRSLRRRLADFPAGAGPRLKPDPKELARRRTRIGALGRGLKVGICWRSQLTDEERADAYTRLDDWAPFFKSPGVRLVNLQYDDCEAEIADVEARYGCKIHRWNDVDLKNDFEAAAAIIAGLDLVVTVATSVGELSASLGVPTWRFGGAGDWSSLGTDCRPWYAAMRVWTARTGEKLPDVLRRMAAALAAANPAAAPAANPAAASAGTVDGVVIDALLKKAVARHMAGDGDEAEKLYNRLAALDPAHADVLHLLGLRRFQTGAAEDAVALMKRAARVDPSFATALSNLGLALGGIGRIADAETAFRRALALRPDFPEATSYYGVNRQLQKDFSGAIRLHRRAATLAPMHGGFRTNLGGALEHAGRWAESSAFYRQALALAPDLYPVALNNMGMAAQLKGDWRTSEIWTRRALRLSPGHPLARWNLGLARLVQGDLAEGWDGYDQRFSTQTLQKPRDVRLPQWRGEALNGRRLLIWDEQGVGDQIMFGSCLQSLSGLDGSVTVEVDRRLVPLFARSFPWAEVRPSEGAPGGPESRVPSDCDLHCPIGSLPGLLRRRLSDFPPRPGAFLTPDPEKTALWRDRLAALPPGLRVGVAWTSQNVDAYRRSSYAALRDLSPILTLEGVQAINLQYGDHADETADFERDFGRRLHMWDDLNLKDDFDSVAALASRLDLVVAPASSVGETAAAVGAPTWRVSGVEWSMLGAGVRPWFPAQRIVTVGPGETVGSTMRRVARMVRALALLHR